MSFDNALARQRAQWQAYLRECDAKDAEMMAESAARAERSAQITEALKRVEARRAGGVHAVSQPQPKTSAVRIYKRAEFDVMDQPAQRAIAKAVTAKQAVLVD